MDSSKKSVFIDVLIILLLLIISLCGVTSFNTKNAYEAVNQYGEVIKSGDLEFMLMIHSLKPRFL